MSGLHIANLWEKLSMILHIGIPVLDGPTALGATCPLPGQGGNSSYLLP